MRIQYLLPCLLRARPARQQAGPARHCVLHQVLNNIVDLRINSTMGFIIIMLIAEPSYAHHKNQLERFPRSIVGTSVSTSPCRNCTYLPLVSTSPCCSCISLPPVSTSPCCNCTYLPPVSTSPRCSCTSLVGPVCIHHFIMHD